MCLITIPAGEVAMPRLLDLTTECGDFQMSGEAADDCESFLSF